MTNILIRHKVNDFAAWKTEFENFADYRKAGGEKSYRVMHPTDDPNEVIVLFEWDSAANARGFLGSEKLKEAMGKAGVTGQPEIHFLSEAFSGTL